MEVYGLVGRGFVAIVAGDPKNGYTLLSTLHIPSRVAFWCANPGGANTVSQGDSCDPESVADGGQRRKSNSVHS